ncbi:MAG: Fibronectin type domain protein, partial [Pedosphaera sp.]|nr:Fibronectin type domain protein [Pedosphaera sp.]
NVFYQGRQSMEIQLLNMGNNGSIGQWNQYGIIDATIPVTPGTLYSFGGFFRSTGITQPSEHWLQWVSSPTSYNTNNRPALPFPNYFTPHFFIGTTNTGWAYANRTFILPAGFPNMELSHHFNIANPGSGSIFMDNIFLRPLPAPGSNVWQEVVPFGSFWRYSINPPPANWYATNFDDSTWLGGNAKLGAGSGPTNIATQITARKTQYFFRRQFLIASTNLEEFLLSARCTDNGGNGPSLQMYLNGRLIPATDIAPVSLQGNDTLYYDLTPFLDYLVPGTNTVAIVLNNTVQSSWDDVAFDVSLKVTPGVGASSSPTHLSSLQRDPDGVTLGIDAPAGTFWRVESSDGSFISPRWQLVDTFTGNGSTYVMRDVGQNNRPPPSAVPSRFYRVVPY